MPMPARCGTAAAIPASRKTATHTTTDPLTGDRSPRSPRNANALGFTSGGFSFSAFATMVFETRALIRVANGFALPFFCTRPLPKQHDLKQHAPNNMFRSILHRTSGQRSPRTGRAVTDFHHEVRKYCVAMLGAGGGRDPQKQQSARAFSVGDSPRCKHRT